MDVQNVDISTLHEDPANARKHDRRNLDAIKASLNKFGQQKPIVVNKDNQVIAGNGTLAAARELGWKQISVSRSDLIGSEATAYAIADNRTAELAAWDDDALRQMLASLQNDEGIDHLVAGFTDDEIAALVDGAETRQADIKIPSIYQVTATCKDEAEQKRIYEILESEGVKCRLSTL